MQLIATNGLSVRLAGRLVLHDIGLAVDRGEIVTVVGPNGSGKSTLLRALVGAVPPSAGRVERAPGLRIGYVPQRLHLDATLPVTVARFLRLGARGGAGDIDQALAETGVSGLAGRQMTALSGGQFQRVLLARALLSAPDLLLLDEPAQGLDQPGIAALYRLVETVRRRLGCGCLMASHDLHVVMGATDRVIALNGIIWCEGCPKTVSSRAEYRALFGEVEEGTLALYPYEGDGSRAPALVGPPDPAVAQGAPGRFEPLGSVDPHRLMPNAMSMQDDELREVPGKPDAPRCSTTS